MAGRSSVVPPRIGRSQCDLAQSLAIAVLEHDRHGVGTGDASAEGEGLIDHGRLLDVDATPFAYGSLL